MRSVIENYCKMETESMADGEILRLSDKCHFNKVNKGFLGQVGLKPECGEMRVYRYFPLWGVQDFAY
jgi:hypothetical protein